MRRPVPTLLCGLLTLLAGAATPAAAQSRGDWKLVWHDEFDGRTLDPKKWNVLLREHSKHDELQYYLPDEVYLENGWLRLRSRVRDYGSMHYTSGRLDTGGKFAPTYGRFEIRARLPAGKGLWPAHWLYPQNRDWPMEYLMAEAVATGKERLIPEARPWYSEIDIMEFLGHEPTVVYGTLHYYTFDGQKKTSSGTWKGDVDFSKDFHVYALEWEPDSIRWYIDGRLIHATTQGIPHTPHYLILNTAVGGAWPGNPDATTVFPQYHDIDYVRVYQRDGYFRP
ncbi:MAG TPA: glycoside hydrolase family 16 protein [Longimicrobiales bacterium]|nr:glycoside hydrolase family 16 protein [Longimicrobiales bacterium]